MWLMKPFSSSLLLTLWTWSLLTTGTDTSSLHTQQQQEQAQHHHQQNTILNSHPCLSLQHLYSMGSVTDIDTETATYTNGQVLECEADGHTYFVKVRTGTRMKDEATLECLSLLTLARDVNITQTSPEAITSAASISITYPAVYFYRGPARLGSDSVCVTEYYPPYTTQTLFSYLRNEITTTDALYISLQAFLDMLLMLKRAGVQHNDIYHNNILVLSKNYITSNTSPSTSGEAIQYSYVLLDFSFSVSSTIHSTQLVDTFTKHLQDSAQSSAPPSGPLCDVYSMGKLLQSLLSRFAFESTRWAYPLVDMMLRRNGSVSNSSSVPGDHNTTTTMGWSLGDVLTLKERLFSMYTLQFHSHTTPQNDKREDRTQLFLYSPKLSLYNEYRRFVTDSCLALSVSCDTFELSRSGDGYTVHAQLGSSLEIGFSRNLGMERPVAVIHNLNRIRWNIIQPVFDELLFHWAHLDVAVLDISGSFSFVCMESFLTYNASCMVLETNTLYGIQMQKALTAFPLTEYRRPIAYRDLWPTLTADYPFEADIITVLGEALWLHYCVEGNLRHVINKLATRAREVLIIEWVDPNDAIITALSQQYPHCVAPAVESTTSAAYSPYTLAEFKQTLSTDFCGLTSFIMGDVSATRYISLNMHVFNQTFYDAQDLTKADFVSPERGHMTNNQTISSARHGQVAEKDVALSAAKKAMKYKRLKQLYNRLVVFD